MPGLPRGPPIGPHRSCDASERAHHDPRHPAAQAASHNSRAPSDRRASPLSLQMQLRQPCSLAEGPQLKYRQQCTLACTCQSALQPSASPCCRASPCASGSARVSKPTWQNALQPNQPPATQRKRRWRSPFSTWQQSTPALPARSKHCFPRAPRSLSSPPQQLPPARMPWRTAACLRQPFSSGPTGVSLPPARTHPGPVPLPAT